MKSENGDSSIAAIGGNIGTIASGHIDHAFRQILRSPLAVAEHRFVRLITGEAHPRVRRSCGGSVPRVHRSISERRAGARRL